MSGNVFGPMLMLIVMAIVDAWILLDARRRADEGHDVVVAVGPIRLTTPAAWLIACLLLWVVAVPLYLVARSA